MCQSVGRQRLYIYCFGLHIICKFLVVSASSSGQVQDTNIKAAQSSESDNVPSHPTNIIVNPSHIRNRRSSLFTGNGHMYDSNEGLNSAFLYNDQIMQNLFSSPSSKPLSYARSNFFLNYLKPRTTRYNAWDDHSLMHFGKRSFENDIKDEKVLIKRSTDLWSQKNDESSKINLVTEIDENDLDSNGKENDSDISDSSAEKDSSSLDVIKKSADPWHSMMSFGKKSQIPWDHNTLHFGKKDDLYSELKSGKRSENFWDHNTMHFGKRDEPWHNMMSFGKKSDPWHNMMSFGKKSDPWHSMMSFGKRSDPWHNMMSFGKKSDNFWDHNTLHFGKKDEPWHNIMSFGKRFENAWDHNTLHFGKRNEWDHNTLHFGKRDPWDHNTLHFGKRNDPWHSMMSFGKRTDNLWDHNTLHFGKKDDPWHNMMSFGKKSEKSDMTDLEKREDPWHNMMSFGKKSDGLLNNSGMTDKRDEPWHNMMSFGKKSDNSFDHNTMHFGKREDPWHNMMSFGKKSGNFEDSSPLQLSKRNEPWHSMMSFGKKSDRFEQEGNVPLEAENYPSYVNYEKKSDGSIDDLSEDFSGNSDPWNEYDNMMFYKKDNPWDHSNLHFGKKSNETWDLITIGKEKENRIRKRSADMWNSHHTMHFGKKFDPWESHNTMHFGKKSDSFENPNENVLESKKNFDEISKNQNIDKKFDWDSHNTMHFGKRDPEDYRNSFLFDKRDHWDYLNTMHFGKREPWDYHNTMHFGKREPWDFHNTMHFGKRNPWDYHNTMHFGKRSSSIPDQTADVNKEIEDTRMENTKSNLDSKTSNKVSNIKKRSSIDPKIRKKSADMKDVKDISDEESSNSKSLLISKATNQPQKIFKSTTQAKFKEKNLKSSAVQYSPAKDQSNLSQTSRIQKRSTNSNSFVKNIEDDATANEDVSDKYSKDDNSDSVLHFGKRSVEIPVDYEEPEFDRENEKRFDDYWNDHNTLHFGKKSDLFDTYNTLHFGKKSNQENLYTLMSNSKRDPWEHYNTLHFGKKFDPWEGHAKLHFRKRSDGLDHNFMNFGKRSDLTLEELDLLRNLEDFGLIKLKNFIQSLDADGENNAEINDFLDNILILKSIINSHLKDENIPFENRVILLKQYLKPILKAIIEAEEIDLLTLSEPNDKVDGRVKNEKDLQGLQRMTPLKVMNGVKNDEAILKNGNDDGSYGEYGDESKMANDSNEYENRAKTKRKYFGKAELKRYFTPFQGPKSIVYPHAWFASQIRRSSLPRTTDYARHMEMRMAEKKEDPFNSYMHFGRR